MIGELENVAIAAVQLVEALRLNAPVKAPVAVTTPVSVAPREAPVSCCCSVNPLPADAVPLCANIDETLLRP
jgi:hypothetical protein